MFTKKTRVISAIATVCMLISMLACIAIPVYAEDVDPNTYPNVQTVTDKVTEGDYKVTGIDDWIWFYSNYSKFQDVDVTIHLVADVDFTGLVNTDTSIYTSATNNSTYNSIYDPAFSLDGHGHSFKNWGSKDAPWKTMGMFRFGSDTGIGMAFIKNVTYDNCHLIGSGSGASIIMRNTGGNAGKTSMATNFTMENVHIKNSSLIGEGNINAMFIGGYATKAGNYTVTMKNCSLIDSTMNAGTGGHSGLLIGKLSSNDNMKVGNVTLSNIYVKGNTFNAGRADYDTLLIGNVEGGDVNLTLKNIFATGNTAKYLEANIGIVMNGASGQGGQHHVDMSGVVLQDNTLSTTAAEASRSIVTDTAITTGTFTDVYCNDTAVTSDIQGKGSLTSKIGDSYFTSGEAAAALNKNATADSLFWYTTTAEGVALGTAAYEFAGWQYNDKALTYKNIFAAGNDTLALNGGNAPLTNTTVENIFTDSNNLFATFNSNADSAHKSVTTEMEGITVMDAAAFKSGEAAYKLNKAAGKTLALVDDSFNAYPVMFATEGYAAPFAVTFVDQSDNNKVVATLYTNASGKLNETAVTALLENDAYGWKNGEADVTAADVYTADTTLTSNATHDWENGTYEQLENNQHKLTCGDDGCTVSKIEDCAHAKYVHRVDGDKHVHDSVCVCGRVLSTEECTLSKTSAGEDQHTVACDTCDYEETVACVFENFKHDDETIGADSTHTGTCACGNDKTEACTFGDWVETTPADYGVCGVETKTCSVAGCGYSYTRTLAMKSHSAIEIVTESVDIGEEPAIEIYLNIDELGLAAGKLTITTDLEICAGEFNEDFLIESEEIEGGIELVFAADENLSGKVLIATLGLAASDEAGEFEVAVDFEDGVVISGEGDASTELPIEVAGATADVVVREAIPGDVNGDGDVTMADAVLVLRVVNGTLNAEEISAVGADVDGVDGITTADAVAILKMVMGKY